MADFSIGLTAKNTHTHTSAVWAAMYAIENALKEP